MYIAYIHGFLSGPNAVKANILQNYLKDKSDFILLRPDFPDTPKEAFLYLDDYFKSYKEDEVALVGSSMGGFFATVLSSKYNFKASLINPCVHPQNYFEALIGDHVNECTNRKFTLTKDMLLVLKDLDSKINFDKNRINVYLQKGDEVLDYKIAKDFYKDCPMFIQDGGCHTFENFEKILDNIINFSK